MSQKSFRSLLAFSQYANNYIEKHEKEQSKTTYALKRVQTQLPKIQATSQETLDNIDADHCATYEDGDKRGVMITDAAGGFTYKPEGLKARNAARVAYFDKPEHEITPHFITVLPKDLTMFEIEAFVGYVLTEADAEKLLAEQEPAEEEKKEETPNE